MTLGNYSIKYGTPNNDTITGGPLEVVLGLAGDDKLTAFGQPVLAGGLGDDTYILPNLGSAIILESGGNDSVVFPFSSDAKLGVVETLDNRHLLIGDRGEGATNSTAIIIDWQNPAKQVENFVFKDRTFTYGQLVSQYKSLPAYKGNFTTQQTAPLSDNYLPPQTGLTPTTLNSFIDDISALAITPPPTVTDFKKDPTKYMGLIRDYDGNNLGGASSWKLLGDADVQGDGDLESILVNPEIGRFASVGSLNGNVDFTKYGLNGDTRVVGIYIDPTLKDKPQNIGGPFDSQRRFQNDLRINNLKLLAAGDYNNDGFQDLYFKLGDGSAVLRALMFKDGNIQYANYQSKSDLATFMTSNNVSSSVWGGWI